MSYDIAHLFDGRLGRRDYVLGSLGLTAISWLGWMILWIAIHGGIIGWTVHSLWIAACAIIGASLTVRRLHDISLSGWLFLVMLIPFIGVLFWIYLIFAKGKGENEYGKSAPKREFFDMLLNK